MPKWRLYLARGAGSRLDGPDHSSGSDISPRIANLAKENVERTRTHETITLHHPFPCARWYCLRRGSTSAHADHNDANDSGSYSQADTGTGNARHWQTLESR